MSKGPRGAARWRKGGGPWKYGKPPINFEPAPKDLQHKHGLTRADLPVYAAHKPVHHPEYLPHQDWTRTAERLILSHGEPIEKLAHFADLRGAGRHEMHVVGDEEAKTAPARAARYYTSHGDKVVNDFLRHGVEHQERRHTPEHLGADPEKQIAWVPAEKRQSWEREGKQVVSVKKLAQETVADLDKFVAGHTLRADASLYRGASLPTDFLNKLRPGARFQDKGFCSTSLNKSDAENLALSALINSGKGEKDAPLVTFHIRARAGQSAGFMEGVTRHRSEYELLLPRGSKFRVVARKDPPPGTRKVGDRTVITLEIES